MIFKNKLTLTLKRQQLITVFLLEYLKKSSTVSAIVLHELFKESKENNEYPQSLKQVDITPVHKKNDKTTSILKT